MLLKEKKSLLIQWKNELLAKINEKKKEDELEKGVDVELLSLKDELNKTEKSIDRITSTLKILN